MKENQKQFEKDILKRYGVQKFYEGDVLARYEESLKLGKSEKEIAEEMGLSIVDLRSHVRVATHNKLKSEAARAQIMLNNGMTLDEIAKAFGYSCKASVEGLLKIESIPTGMDKALAMADILKKELDEKGSVDIGERTDPVLQEALYILDNEGYHLEKR